MTIKTKITWDNGVSTVVEVDTSQKLLKNFTVKELANTSADDEIKMISTPRSRLFLNMVQEMRNTFGSIVVNSNYRTAAFNRKVGGDHKSRHLYGEALDWQVGKKKMTDAYFSQLCDKWKSLCEANGEIGEINRYTDGVHIGIGADISYGATSFVVRDYRGKKGDW